MSRPRFVSLYRFVFIFFLRFHRFLQCQTVFLQLYKVLSPFYSKNFLPHLLYFLFLEVFSKFLIYPLWLLASLSYFPFISLSVMHYGNFPQTPICWFPKSLFSSLSMVYIISCNIKGHLISRISIFKICYLSFFWTILFLSFDFYSCIFFRVFNLLPSLFQNKLLFSVEDVLILLLVLSAKSPSWDWFPCVIESSATLCFCLCQGLVSFNDSKLVFKLDYKLLGV